MAAAVTKSVLVSYIDRNKVIRIPHGKPSGLDDLQFFESEFKTLFFFQKNIRLCVTFQRYDKDWEEYVDLEPTDIIENKDKLGAVVSPLLEDSISVSISASTPTSTALVESDTASIYATTSDTGQRNRGVDTQGAIVNLDNSFSDGTPLRSLTVPRTRKKHLDEAVLEPKQPEDTPSPDSLKKPRRRLHLESDETSQLDMDTDKPQDKSPILYIQCTTKVIKIE